VKLSDRQKELLDYLQNESYLRSKIESWMKTQTVASLAAAGAIQSRRNGYIQITELGLQLRLLKHLEYKEQLKKFSKKYRGR